MRVDDQIRSILESEAAHHEPGRPRGSVETMRLGSRRRVRKRIGVSMLAVVGLAVSLWVSTPFDWGSPIGSPGPATTVPGTLPSVTTLPAVSTPTSVVSPTTVPPTTSPSTTPLAGEAVMVAFTVSYASDCNTVELTERIVGPTQDVYTGSFEHLVGGPTQAENDAGLISMFSEATQDAVRSATLIDGLLVVDFNDIRVVMSNASTSCGSEALITQLNATAFQFEAVEAVRYQIEGSCETFFNWLQRDCVEYSRP